MTLPLTFISASEFDELRQNHGIAAHGLNSSNGSATTVIANEKGTPIAIRFISEDTDGDPVHYLLDFEAPLMSELSIVSGHCSETDDDEVLIVEGDDPSRKFIERQAALSYLQNGVDPTEVCVTTSVTLEEAIDERIGSVDHDEYMSLFGTAKRLHQQWLTVDDVDMDDANALISAVKDNPTLKISPDFRAVLHLTESDLWIPSVAHTVPLEIMRALESHL